MNNRFKFRIWNTFFKTWNFKGYVIGIDEFIKQTKGTDEEQRLVDEKKLGKQCKSLENWGIKIIKGTVNI